jgi:hypothetical protein
METKNVCGQVFHSMVSGLDWQPAKFRTSPEQPNVLGEMQDVLDYRFARLVVLRECCSRDHHAGSMHDHAGSIHGVHSIATIAVVGVGRFISASAWMYFRIAAPPCSNWNRPLSLVVAAYAFR